MEVVIRFLLLLLAIVVVPTQGWTPFSPWSQSFGNRKIISGPKTPQPKQQQQPPIQHGISPIISSTPSRSSSLYDFSFANLFGLSNGPTGTTTTATTTTTTPNLRSNNNKNSGTGPKHHPSVRNHISPLGRFQQGQDPVQTIPTSELLPHHPDVVSGVLESNGMPYIILPNNSPEGRFEAHLQVFSGSADELESQQGIAHLTEHVAYMGSRKRERLFGTGSQTNAYTDFHHTVFYAACPVKTPMGNLPMLPMALDALVDVMEAKVEPTRLEKERAAVLSEMTMVNTMEYRVECQILSTLHRENRLAKRFPIGKEILIQNWQTDHVLTWHRTHYRPDNVLLYLVGDIQPQEAVDIIKKKFSHISADKQALDIKLLRDEASDLATALNKASVKAAQSWHFPPVRHDWCVPQNKIVADALRIPNQLVPIDSEDGPLEVDANPLPVKLNNDHEVSAVPATTENNNNNKPLFYDLQLQQSYKLDEPVAFLETKHLEPGKDIRPHIYKHELLQAFSLHLFAKRPVEEIIDLDSFRRSMARRVALAALQIRLNVGGRSDDPAFTFVEFNQLDSAREGCAVCSLDMNAEPKRWKDAIAKALSEIRKLGLYGVTPEEKERYASSLMTDAEQMAAQGDQISHGDQLAYLMETVANGHTFMSPMQSYQITAKALSTLTLEEVNQAAAELCSHVKSFHKDAEPVNGPTVVIACMPKGFDDPADPAYCDEESLVQTIYDACQLPVEPEQGVVVPHTLIPEEELALAMKLHVPQWSPGRFTDGTPDTPADKLTRPFTLRRLANGIRVGVAPNTAESQRGHLRLVAPGGRDAERRLGFKNGAMAIGSRTMQEGGAFGPWTREQVELFCVDHLIMVEIKCTEEALVFDFVFPTTNVGNLGFGDDVKLGITGTESVMQILREILVGFIWEADALGRSKQSFRSSHESLLKNLEGLSTERVAEAVTSQDPRFLSINVDDVNNISLQEAKEAVMSQLYPGNLEISIAGDFDIEEVLDLVFKYIGTIPAETNGEYRLEPPKVPNWTGRVPSLQTPGRHLQLELPDSDPRAVAYVSGAAPNAWGYLSDGTTVTERVLEAAPLAKDAAKQRRSHPLFAYAALNLLSEIVNRRLFSNVREKKQLTYDANFSFSGFERLLGGWFLVTVTASKQNAQKALDACKETLTSLRKTSPITLDNVEAAKRVVLNRHNLELRTSSYWTQLMSGIQEESIPLKGPLSVTDFAQVVLSITPEDVQLTLETLTLDEDKLYTAIAQTVRPEGSELKDDDVVRPAPVIGMRRGGALSQHISSEKTDP